MSSNIQPMTSASVKSSETLSSPRRHSHKAQTLAGDSISQSILPSGLSSTPRPVNTTTTISSETISRKKTLPSTQGASNFKNTQVGTPRAMGTLRDCQSPALLHHLTSMPPSIAHYRFSMKSIPLPKLPAMMQPDHEDQDHEDEDEDCKDSLSEFTDSSDTDRTTNELKAQLVLNATRAQQDVRLAEKTLADCILKENTVLGKLYKFEATVAERMLEDANIDISFVRHSVRKSGITLYEDSKPRKQCRQSTSSQVDTSTLRPEGDSTRVPGTSRSASVTLSMTFESEAAGLDLELLPRSCNTVPSVIHYKMLCLCCCKML
ncbi:uncharacterized protein HD556DRAFT_1306901 [Suillus plorans]|uniref:Uncharacterized protein n=1 Tax=Suillus plorans TaxID=116603 RepID=A0A9P7ATW3_9AGAM|nr:uncharacterized protein HD556DRAFT_1306901 [Suillus plorans]KAG1796718.1 hypothetical protein HD556DRAFT_1306901 [Suillus plorans]